MENCEQRCINKQIKVNNKHDEIKATHKTDRYSNDDLKQYNKLDDELENLKLDLQRCIADCKLRNRNRDVDDYSKDGKHVDPEILQELKALEEEDEYSGGRTRSTIHRNKRKTKRRQTRSTRRRKTRRRSSRRNRKQ